MRQLKHALPDMITQATTREAGEEREIIIRVTPDRIYFRATRCKQWHVLPIAKGMLHACAIEAGFDPSPVRKLVRGGVGM